MGGRGNKQVCDASSVRSTGIGNCSDHLSVAAGCGGVEGKGLEGGFDLLQAGLTTSTLGRSRGQMGAGRKFGKSDRANRGLLGQGGGQRVEIGRASCRERVFSSV